MLSYAVYQAVRESVSGQHSLCVFIPVSTRLQSIAEMMATRARVQCWDNSTRGLDASTALDFVKSLRIMTDILGQTTFVTLYAFFILFLYSIMNQKIGIKLVKVCLVHASSLLNDVWKGIYNLFDKVMVLDNGRQVYFGPPSQARAYFEQMGEGAFIAIQNNRRLSFRLQGAATPEHC